MKTIPIGNSSLRGSRLAYGCWRVTGSWNPSEITPESWSAGCAAVLAAYEAGYTVFDNAAIYCGGQAERLLGEVLKKVPGMRERVVVATKCGIRIPGDPTPEAPARYDFSADHILHSCEQSLRRLGLETIDLFMLHRPDFLANPTEIAGAFSNLLAAGKVRYFGVSNFRPTLVAALQSACPMPLLVNQVEISLAKLDAFTDGTLDQCLSSKITPMAWSPLAGGRLFDPSQPAASRLAAAVKNMSARYHGATLEQLAYAWIMAHPSGPLPVIGTNKLERIQSAAKADDIVLEREDWYALWEAAQGRKIP